MWLFFRSGSLLFQAGLNSDPHLVWAQEQAAVSLLETRTNRDCFPWMWSESGSPDGGLKAGLVCVFLNIASGGIPFSGSC